MKTKNHLFCVVACLVIPACGMIVSAAPLGTAFTYQGHLYDSNSVAGGLYDFQFSLHDSNTAGSQVAGDANVADVDVIDGYFTVELDFGSAFDGDTRWLEIGVRPGVENDPCSYEVLLPRQEVTPAPYALYAASGPGVPVPLELSGSVAYPGSVIKGTNASNGYGVYGTSSNGNYGWLGGSSYGVYGRDFDSGNFGYLGGGSYAVYGSSSTGRGVYGYSGGSSDGVYGYSDSGYGVHGKQSSSGNFGYLGGSSYGAYGKNGGNYGYLGGDLIGVYGFSVSGYGVEGYSSNGYGVYGYSVNSHAGFFSGSVYVTSNVSALSFTDRTPYPSDLATAYEAVMSMERLPDGQYDEMNKETQLDHSALSDFIRSEDGHRDLSATVSCQNEVLKDIIRKQDQLGKDGGIIELLKQQVEVLHAQNESLKQRLEVQEKTLQQLQIVITKGAVQ